MEYFGYLSSICYLFGMIQILSGASVKDKYEPMVAFICDRPAMHRGVNGWIPDKSQNCPDTLEQVLTYCKKVYPDHNITNVVESSSFYNITNWPMGNAGRQHTHHVRPFRCLVGGFQSDALLVPQHCEFDHRHDITQCKEFSHWNRVAEDACLKKGMHLESFGMLLYCNTLGHFNGVEYVCCPNPSSTRVQPEPKGDDIPDKWQKSNNADEDHSEEDEDESDEEDKTPSAGNFPDENTMDFYEAYLRGEIFPSAYNNEHKQYLAAKSDMLKHQKKKESTLLQQWEQSREHITEVRKTDPKTADKMNEEIATRFKHLYASFKQEDASEKQQLLALHLQHIQAKINQRKREAIDHYMRALETGEVDKVIHYLHNYIRAVEKDRAHTVNHFKHVRMSNPKEAVRIHPYIIHHLKLSEIRIDQAMDMLKHYPEIERTVRPEVEEFMKNYDAIATEIKNDVLPVPVVEEESKEETSDSSEAVTTDNSDEISIDESDSSESEESASVPEQVSASDNDMTNIVDDEVQENEHSYEKSHHFSANAFADVQSAKHGLSSAAKSSSQIGSTIGIALGSVSVFVIIVVAVMMVHRNRNKQSVAHGYVEVDPSATPEERHLANMQMNGYENPTYKYFEVQNNPKA